MGVTRVCYMSESNMSGSDRSWSNVSVSNTSGSSMSWSNTGWG